MPRPVAPSVKSGAKIDAKMALHPRLIFALLPLAAFAMTTAHARVTTTQPTSAPYPREFEVASVKPNTLDDRVVQVRVGPGPTFMARGYTLVLLMQRAYGVMDWNITGGPDWIRVDRFDVAAKAAIDGDLAEDALKPMLANLLARRFKLRLHETSELRSAHALEVARGGAKLRPSTSAGDRQDSFRFTDEGLDGQAVSMTDFARFVGGKLGLPAVDLTGLTGVYDVRAAWRVGPREIELAGGDQREAMRNAVLAALETQLGLKLSPKTVPMRTLVIDTVERASALDN